MRPSRSSSTSWLLFLAGCARTAGASAQKDATGVDHLASWGPIAYRALPGAPAEGEPFLGVITGEVGTGKTVAARAARATLDPSRHALIYIANPAFGTRGLYVSVVRALGGTPRFFKAEVMARPASSSRPRRPSATGGS